MNDQKKPSEPQSTSDRIPHKPTRESATASRSPEEASKQRAEPAGQKTSEKLGSGRREVGGGVNSNRHPPHVTENDEDAPIQRQTVAENDTPGLPANASGSDAVPVDEQDEQIDDESMYDRRPERDKDRPPSNRTD